MLHPNARHQSVGSSWEIIRRWLWKGAGGSPTPDSLMNYFIIAKSETFYNYTRL